MNAVRCLRCHRPLRNPTANGLGPVCGKQVAQRDEETRELWFDIDAACEKARCAVRMLIEDMTRNALLELKRQASQLRRERLGAVA